MKYSKLLHQTRSVDRSVHVAQDSVWWAGGYQFKYIHAGYLIEFFFFARYIGIIHFRAIFTMWCSSLAYSFFTFSFFTNFFSLLHWTKYYLHFITITCHYKIEYLPTKTSIFWFLIFLDFKINFTQNLTVSLFDF